MAIQENIPAILKHVQANEECLRHNHKLFTIYEGELLQFIEADMQATLSPQFYEQVKCRIPPLNLLKKIVDKLSTIYRNPTRSPVGDSVKDSDAELLNWYEQQFDIDANMNVANEFFNLFKNTLIEPYVADNKPYLRCYPSDQFMVWSDDARQPNKPTHIIIPDGTHQLKCPKTGQYEKVAVFRIYTDEEFKLVDSKGNILWGKLDELGNPDGVNIYGQIPFVYVNRSKNLLWPLPDTDTLRMTKLIPVQLADLSAAIMFQAFSIIIGIDVSQEGLRMSPNAFWEMKSEGDGEKKPQIEVLKPQVDIEPVMNFIQAEIALWMQTRGLRPASLGNLGPDQFASGISKMVDEADATDEREKQVKIFEAAESQLWDLVLHVMHPVWADNNLVENNTRFTETARVLTNFEPPVPAMQRGDLVDTIIKEMDAGLLTRADALRRLDPRLSDEEAEKKVAEIDEEKAIKVPPMPEEDEAANDEEDEAVENG